MNNKTGKPRESKDPKPFVYLGPGSPKLFYPRGPKKITKFPLFVVHKNSLKPHSYLFPSVSDKPVIKPPDGINPDDQLKPENNNDLETPLGVDSTKILVDSTKLLVDATNGKSYPIVVEDQAVLEILDCGMNWENDNSLGSPIDFEKLMPDLNLSQEEMLQTNMETNKETDMPFLD